MCRIVVTNTEQAGGQLREAGKGGGNQACACWTLVTFGQQSMHYAERIGVEKEAAALSELSRISLLFTHTTQSGTFVRISTTWK